MYTSYNYHGNGSTVGRSGCSNPDKHSAIIIICDINDVAVVI